MAPETEETTQDAVETTPEAPPVTPEETGAEPVDAPPVNELSEFRAARKAERNGEVSDDAEEKPPAPEAATEESESIATETIDPDKHVYDPDTGEVLDRRTRAAKRIEVLLRERHLLRQQLAGQQPPSEVPAQTPAPEAQAAPAEEPEPTLAQFSQEPDPYAAFMAANARWHARQEFQKQAAEQSTADRTAQVEARVQEAQSSWDGKLDEVRTRLPDFDKAYSHMYQALPTDGRQRPLVETLLTSPIGHDLAHYLGTNPKAVTDLYNQPTLKAHLRAIGKIEAQVEAQLSKGATPVSTPVDTPPPPMNPVGAGATPTNYNSSTATMAQFRKHYGVRGGRRNA
jgi:hypothetical protein